MSGLIYQITPYADEGFIGYFRRLAKENGFGNWKALIKAAGVNPSGNALWKNHKRISKELGVDAKSLEVVMPSVLNGKGLYDSFYHRNLTEPICVECIKEAEYLRQAWCHSFISACPLHKLRLIDCCPSCNLKLDNTRSQIAFCDCGFDLRFTEPQVARLSEIWISARLAGDMRVIEGISEIGKPADYVHLAKLLFQLVTRYDLSLELKPGKISKPKDIEETLAFLSPALAIFVDWRPRFSEHVTDRFSATPEKGYSLSKRLGAWYNNLHAICKKNGAFSELWQVFSDMAFENFDGMLRGQNVLTPSVGKQRTYISLAEAARLIGISAQTLFNAAEQKLISVRLNRQGNNYQVAMISREEAEMVCDLRSDWLSEKAAAEQLGIADSILQNLVRAEIIPCDVSYRLSFYKGGPIPAESLNSLYDTLACFMEEKKARETLTFNQLNARRTVDIKALNSLYKAIFAGEVRAVGWDTEHRLGGFIFSSEDIRKYLGSVALSNALTLTQLEQATGWKYEVLNRWTELGVLESETIQLQGKPARVVTFGAFAKFRREWIPVSEIAYIGHSKSSAITARLLAKGVDICGQTEFEKGTRRGGLIRVAELIHLAELISKPSRRLENTAEIDS